MESGYLKVWHFLLSPTPIHLIVWSLLVEVLQGYIKSSATPGSKSRNFSADG